MQTAAIDAIKAYVTAKGWSYTDLGTYSCRPARRADGTSLGYWSEHAWGNAWDIKGPDLATTKWYKGQLLSAGLPIAYIVGGTASYPHLHINGSPEENPGRNQVPPCAGNGDDEDVEELTKKIQQGLKDAGFYGGAIDGNWGPKTTAAWSAAMTSAKQGAYHAGSVHYTQALHGEHRTDEDIIALVVDELTD